MVAIVGKSIDLCLRNSFHNLAQHLFPLCDGVPCGYTRVEDREGDVDVHELDIDPEFQGKGVGRTVLREVIECASARQVPVRLGTFHENRAVDLYRGSACSGAGGLRRISTKPLTLDLSKLLKQVKIRFSA